MLQLGIAGIAAAQPLVSDSGVARAIPTARYGQATQVFFDRTRSTIPANFFLQVLQPDAWFRAVVSGRGVVTTDVQAGPVRGSREMRYARDIQPLGRIDLSSSGSPYDPPC